jgi:hypothetical protein
LRKVLFVATLGVLLLASSCAQPAAAPPPQEEGTIRVEVSRFGFNKTPGEFTLEAEAGQEVEIIFVYGDGDFSENNPHIITIPDYGIENVFLDKDNPEVTVSFPARAGEVAFMCTLETCVGHTNLQRGILVIE